MNIELSLRRRSAHARLLSALWLAVATVLLVSACAYLAHASKDMLRIFNNATALGAIINAAAKPDTQPLAATDTHVQIFALTALFIGFLGIVFLCFLLGRASLYEMALSARFSGLADALCIAGNEFDKFEKAAALLVPKAKHLSIPEILSSKDVKAIADILKPTT